MSKPLPSEMVSTSASSDSASNVLSEPESNNTPCVSNLSERLQEASSLKSLETRMVRKPGTYADNSDDTYGPRNNQNEIDIFSVRDSATRKQEMTYSISCSTDEIQTQDPKGSSSTMQLSHGETEDLSLKMKLSHNDAEDLSSKINTSVQYSSNTVEDLSSKINTNVCSVGIHKPEQQASMKSSQPIDPLPHDCIKPMYKETGPPEGGIEHRVLEKLVGYLY